MPLYLSVHNVKEADGQNYAYFEIIFGKNFNDKLPEAIKSIVIFGPNGKLPINKDNFSYIPGIPEKGTYRFEVRSDEHIGSTIDYQHTIPKNILKKGHSYRWRLRVADCDDWLNVQNRSHTEWKVFYIL